MTQPVAAGPVCYRHPGRETYIVCQRCQRPICTDCMRSASVGFHCPDCVREGTRATRSGRAAYGGVRSGNPGLTSQVLVGLNALVWFAIVASGGAASTIFDKLSLLPVTSAYAKGREIVVVRGVVGSDVGPGGAYWQFLTTIFTHVDVMHILFNMLALWILGPQLELVLGRARFLALYLLSGLGGSVMVFWLAGEHSQTLGASGAIFGLMGALLVVTLKVGGEVQSVLAWIAINFVITFVFGANISWQGHVGGFISGVALGALIVYAPRANRVQVQVAGMTAFGFLLVVLTAVRVAALS